MYNVLASSVIPKSNLRVNKRKTVSLIKLKKGDFNVPIRESLRLAERSYPRRAGNWCAPSNYARSTKANG